MSYTMLANPSSTILSDEGAVDLTNEYVDYVLGVTSELPNYIDTRGIESAKKHVSQLRSAGHKEAWLIKSTLGLSYGDCIVLEKPSEYELKCSQILVKLAI